MHEFLIDIHIKQQFSELNVFAKLITI